MILWHRSWGRNELKHECNTLSDFIENVIEKEFDKENKYFRIALKNQFNGKENMLLYYQNGILKSHHSTQRKFDYKDVLEWEIRPEYSVDELNLENIKSYDFDNIDEYEEHLKYFYYDRNKLYYINLNRSNENDIERSFRKLEESREQRNFLEDNTYDIKNIDKILKMIVEDKLYPEERVRFKSVVELLVNEIEQLKAQIKWLEKKIN